MRALTSTDVRVESGSGLVIMQGQRSGFVKEAYAGGAWLVLPALLAGCLARAAGMPGPERHAGTRGDVYSACPSSHALPSAYSSCTSGPLRPGMSGFTVKPIRVCR